MASKTATDSMTRNHHHLIALSLAPSSSTGSGRRPAANSCGCICVPFPPRTHKLMVLPRTQFSWSATVPPCRPGAASSAVARWALVHGVRVDLLLLPSKFEGVGMRAMPAPFVCADGGVVALIPAVEEEAGDHADDDAGYCAAGDTGAKGWRGWWGATGRCCC